MWSKGRPTSTTNGDNKNLHEKKRWSCQSSNWIPTANQYPVAVPVHMVMFVQSLVYMYWSYMQLFPHQ